ncbi:chorismate mutase [Alloscardovia theropitheci]|uniref:Chorismate mutase n=1 Tax=Alloscardovia theropitheci TaxID=2496842 RepID=A0A4R0QWK1_9BIFI|nr:chorismate mutase [Alloscardovia theropitheci]TCD53900.1 chorismate mutase [Alloscardovia theropitheci]
MSENENENETVNENTQISSELVDEHTSAIVSDAIRGIEEQREIIDSIDDDIVRLLARRFKATKRVGQLKAKAGFAALDSARENRQRDRLRVIAAESGLEQEIAEGYLEFVVGQSKKRHKKIAEEGDN